MKPWPFTCFIPAQIDKLSIHSFIYFLNKHLVSACPNCQHNTDSQKLKADKTHPEIHRRCSMQGNKHQQAKDTTWWWHMQPGLELSKMPQRAEQVMSPHQYLPGDKRYLNQGNRFNRCTCSKHNMVHKVAKLLRVLGAQEL